MSTTSVLAPGTTAARSTPVVVAAGAKIRLGLYQGGLGAPAASALSTTAGGTLAATTYFVRTTYVTPAGETTAAAETSLAAALDTVLNVASPPAAGAGAQTATGWNVYVSTATGTETKQNASPIAIGTAWVEPIGGLIAGSALPSADTTGGGLPQGGVDCSVETLNPDGATHTPTGLTLSTRNPSITIDVPGSYTVLRPTTSGLVGVVSDT